MWDLADQIRGICADTWTASHVFVGSHAAPNAATHKATTWLVFPGRPCVMASLDETAMAGGKTRKKVPACEKA
jgi:hypothetical protein